MEIPFSILSATPDHTPSPVAEIKEQIDSLLELLAQQEEDLRLARLMLHRANTEVTLYGKAPPPDYTATLGYAFETDFFMVVAMDLADRSQLFSSTGTSRFSQREVELMKMAVYNVFETALGPYCLATCCESDLAFANILINFIDDDPPADKIIPTMDRVLQTAVDVVERNYRIRLVVDHSAIVKGHQNLPNARIAAYHRLQQKFALENLARTQAVLPVSGENLPAAKTVSPKLEKQYYQFVLSRDLDMAKLTLRELTSHDLTSPDVTFELAKLRFLNHAESLVNIVGLSASEVQYLYLRPLDTDQAIFQLIEDLFADIAEQSVSSEQARQVKMEAVRDYIQENYADSGLCLAKICDKFQMNQSYLSRTFKEIFGIGILDFIHSQRLLHAKALLKDSANQIDMIWESVGYTNRRTFNRSFRKLENMSASEYRKSVSASR